MNTNIEATQDSNTVITKTFMPLPLRAFNLKNCPVLNAINASAMFGRNAVLAATKSGTRFRQ